MYPPIGAPNPPHPVYVSNGGRQKMSKFKLIRRPIMVGGSPHIFGEQSQNRTDIHTLGAFWRPALDSLTGPGGLGAPMGGYI